MAAGSVDMDERDARKLIEGRNYWVSRER